MIHLLLDSFPRMLAGQSLQVATLQVGFLVMDAIDATFVHATVPAVQVEHMQVERFISKASSNSLKPNLHPKSHPKLIQTAVTQMR